jgi:hypothetical protein
MPRIAPTSVVAGEYWLALRRYLGVPMAPGSAARFYYPYAVAVDASGHVYVGDTYNFTVRKITPAGVVTDAAWYAGRIWECRWHRQHCPIQWS